LKRSLQAGEDIPWQGSSEHQRTHIEWRQIHSCILRQRGVQADSQQFLDAPQTMLGAADEKTHVRGYFIWLERLNCTPTMFCHHNLQH
jgi:hypothetical protein